jgi:hypothetical protein
MTPRNPDVSQEGLSAFEVVFTSDGNAVGKVREAILNVDLDAVRKALSGEPDDHSEGELPITVCANREKGCLVMMVEVGPQFYADVFLHPARLDRSDSADLEFLQKCAALVRIVADSQVEEGDKPTLGPFEFWKYTDGDEPEPYDKLWPQLAEEWEAAAK